jgi:hypothetical protein
MDRTVILLSTNCVQPANESMYKPVASFPQFPHTMSGYLSLGYLSHRFTHHFKSCTQVVSSRLSSGIFRKITDENRLLSPLSTLLTITTTTLYIEEQKEGQLR